MGAYLSEPVRTKIPVDETTDTLHYGASSMQGWRISQEDAHNCCPKFDTQTSLFAVYDGHGGGEVAQYTAENFPEFLKSLTMYKEKHMAQALEEGFLQFDAKLTEEDVVQKLKELAGVETDSEDGDEDEAAMLFEEADMPLDQLLKRYSGMGGNPKNIRNLRKKDNIQSPMIKPKKEGLLELNKADTEGSEVKLNLEDQLVNGHPESSKSSEAVPADSTESTGNEAKPAAKSADSDCQVSSNTDGKTETKSADVCASASASKSDTVTCSSDSGVSVSTSGVSVSTSGGSNQRDDSSSSTSCTPQAGDSTSSTQEWDEQEGGVSSSTVGPSGDYGGSSGGSSAGAAGSCAGSASQETEPCSSSGRTRKKKSGVIPAEGEDESSFDEDEEDTEDDDSDEDAEPWKSGSDDSDDSEEEDEEVGPFPDRPDGAEDGDEEQMVMSGGDDPGQESGCTAVVSLMYKDQLYVANAGDSRCVLCRGGMAIDLSEDHKPEDAVEFARIVKAGGKVTPDGRVNGGLNLSRALGDHCYKNNKDLSDKEQMITSMPDIRTITLQEDDEFMVLACDGIWNVMSSQDVITFIRERIQAGVDKLSSICEEMFDLCLAPDTKGDGTGCDNMTCIIVSFKPNPNLAKSTNQPTESSADSSRNNTKTNNGTSSSQECSEAEAVSSDQSQSVASTKRKAEEDLEQVDSSQNKKSKVDSADPGV